MEYIDKEHKIRVLESKITVKQAAIKKLHRDLNLVLDSIKDIRDFDCGAWLKDGDEADSKRIKLMKLLNKLYVHI